MAGEPTKEELLRFAKAVIVAGLNRDPGPEVPPEWSPNSGACFVTLTLGGRLRGCIGSLAAYRPLGEDLKANALAAAFEDPRFPPLRAEEWPRVKVEISLLTPPKPWSPAHPTALLEELQTLKPGLIITRGYHRATFLPQVWDQLPDPSDFLTHLCLKAGLDEKAWQKPDLKYEIYQVEKWGDEETD